MIFPLWNCVLFIVWCQMSQFCSLSCNHLELGGVSKNEHFLIVLVSEWFGLEIVIIATKTLQSLLWCITHWAFWPKTQSRNVRFLTLLDKWSLSKTFWDKIETYLDSFYAFWLILTRFDLSWLILTHLDSFCLISTNLNSSRLNSTHLKSSLLSTIQHDSVRLSKTQHGLAGVSKTRYDSARLSTTQLNCWVTS